MHLTSRTQCRTANRGGYAVLLAIAILPVQSGCVRSTPLHDGFDRVRIQMSLTEVETILGKGEQIDGQYVPRASDGHGHAEKVIKGDKFYEWKDTSDEKVWIGFSHGRVVDKYMYQPAL